MLGCMNMNLKEQKMNNPLKMCGIEFTEFVGPNNNDISQIFLEFGFSKIKKCAYKNIICYNQNEINLLLNYDKNGHAADFARQHGPSICSMGWRVEDAEFAFDEAIRRGAQRAHKTDLDYPAIYGIGNSIIYFVNQYENKKKSLWETDFIDLDNPIMVQSKGFLSIDHLTNNVFRGTMDIWAEFYKKVFGFKEVRYFDIRGQKTALLSYALQSPDGSFCIPINEGRDDNNNQIDEYLDEYRGSGIQHLAFSTKDLVKSCDLLEDTCIKTLDIHENYYDTVFDRVPWIKENKEKIREHQILLDSQKEGTYLLQIFTKNLFGPIFIELIQREGDNGFGEGNFQSLFNSIERDQIKRGVI